MGQETDRLRTMLRAGRGELSFLDKLDPQSAARLTAHLQEAKRAHHQHLEDSMQQALEHFPRLLRGPIKKIFGM